MHFDFVLSVVALLYWNSVKINYRHMAAVHTEMFLAYYVVYFTVYQ